MPSLLPGYEYDIFLSYRQNDNRSGWVTEFVKALQEELAAAIKDPVAVYFDENPHDGLQQHHEVDDSLKEKLRCLVLIPIVSQTYCDPKAFAWEHELLAFIKLASEDTLGLKTKVGGGNTASRVLPVRIHDVDARDKKLFEEATGGVMRPIDFIYKESGVNRPLRNSDDRNRNQEQTDYRNQVNKVANAIKEIITGMQGKEESSSPGESAEVKRDPVRITRESRPRRKSNIRFPDSKTFALIAALVTLITVTTFHFSETPPDQKTYRSAILPPEKTTFSTSIGGNISLSPDGSLMAFVTEDSTGTTRLWVRPLNAIMGHVLDGTDGASMPFWSPDSRFIGFFAGGKLKKIETAGGPAQILCDAPSSRGGTWNDKGTIIFSAYTNVPLSRVSAAGGLPVTLTKLDSSRLQVSHRWPHFLPDGVHFLYATRTVLGGVGEGDGIFIASLDTTFAPQFLVNATSNVDYANGHLLFVSVQMLMAQPFDASSLQITGDAFPIAQQVYFSAGTGKASFSVSHNGILTYQTGESFAGATLQWHDRSGKKEGAIVQPAEYNDFRISPDGKRIAISKLISGNSDIWLYEITRAGWTRFTFSPASERWPLWSPDGGTIVFASDRQRRMDLYQGASGGAGSEEILLRSNIQKYPSDWSRDGRFIAYHVDDPKTYQDIWILPMNPKDERKPFPFLQTEFNESRPAFSPDGGWIAYQSDESGRNEVYIRPFPGPGSKLKVSANGGTRPRWHRDGKELFYLGSDNKIMAAEIKPNSFSIDLGSVRPLFQIQRFGGSATDVYGVTGDGQHFIVASAGSAFNSSVTLVVNWPGEIKK